MAQFLAFAFDPTSLARDDKRIGMGAVDRHGKLLYVGATGTGAAFRHVDVEVVIRIRRLGEQRQGKQQRKSQDGFRHVRLR
jgi:hypothetical protein